MNYFLKIITIIFFSLLSFANLSFAISEDEAKYFMKQIESLMNRRDIDEIKNFLTFYTNSDAVFIKESYLVDSDDNEKTIGSESLKMSLSEYLIYLKGILTLPKKFSYNSDIKSIDINLSTHLANVSLNITDSSAINGYDDFRKMNYVKYILTTSSCNYALEYKNAHFYIAGMNCVEKINKTFDYSNLDLRD